jgi:predicted nucleic acid-binding protein
LLAELKNVLHSKIALPREIISDFVEVLIQDSILAKRTKLTNIDINDKDDILILSTSLNAKAELFVTGDKELLELEKIQSMRIISPRRFWETLKTSPD